MVIPCNCTEREPENVRFHIESNKPYLPADTTFVPKTEFKSWGASYTKGNFQWTVCLVRVFSVIFSSQPQEKPECKSLGATFIKIAFLIVLPVAE